MGNKCKGTRPYPSTASDPMWGLSLKEVDLIRYLWLAIYERANLNDTGVLFWLKLLDRHPYMKNFFPEFSKESLLDLEHNSDFRAHVITVFAEISKYVDYVDDSEVLVSLINKRTRGHFVYGITCTDMENFKEVFLEFLEERGEGLIQLPEALEAWNKLLTAHNTVFKKTTAELVNSKRLSVMALRQAQATGRSFETSTDKSLEVRTLKSDTN